MSKNGIEQLIKETIKLSVDSAVPTLPKNEAWTKIEAALKKKTKRSFISSRVSAAAVACLLVACSISFTKSELEKKADSNIGAPITAEKDGKKGVAGITAPLQTLGIASGVIKSAAQEQSLAIDAPAGFVFKRLETNNQGNETALYFAKKGKEVAVRNIYSQVGFDPRARTDTPGSKKVSIGGEYGVIAPINGHRKLVWKSGNYTHEIEGDLTDEELLAAAKSIK